MEKKRNLPRKKLYILKLLTGLYRTVLLINSTRATSNETNRHNSLPLHSYYIHVYWIVPFTYLILLFWRFARAKYLWARKGPNDGRQNQHEWHRIRLTSVNIRRFVFFFNNTCQAFIMTLPIKFNIYSRWTDLIAAIKKQCRLATSQNSSVVSFLFH